MPLAGALRDRYTFQVRHAPTGDADTGAWADQFTVWAQTQFLHGTEPVQAQRLQGKQPVVVTVRASSQTRAITNAWRMVDARDGSRVFDITAVEITPDRAWVQVLAVTSQGQS